MRILRGADKDNWRLTTSHAQKLYMKVLLLSSSNQGRRYTCMVLQMVADVEKRMRPAETDAGVLPVATHCHTPGALVV